MTASSNAVGAPHVCFEIEDVQATFERLSTAGSASSPLRCTKTGEWEGAVMAYAFDPDENRVELFQHPRADA